MKVIHLISGGDTGGAKTHVHSLLHALGKTAEVTLVCFRDGPFAEGGEGPGHRHARLSRPLLCRPRPGGGADKGRGLRAHTLARLARQPRRGSARPAHPPAHRQHHTQRLETRLHGPSHGRDDLRRAQLLGAAPHQIPRRRLRRDAPPCSSSAASAATTPSPYITE